MRSSSEMGFELPARQLLAVSPFDRHAPGRALSSELTSHKLEGLGLAFFSRIRHPYDGVWKY